MGNVHEINVRECDVIREIRENFVLRTFPRIRYNGILAIIFGFGISSFLPIVVLLPALFTPLLADIKLCTLLRVAKLTWPFIVWIWHTHIHNFWSSLLLGAMAKYWSQPVVVWWSRNTLVLFQSSSGCANKELVYLSSKNTLRKFVYALEVDCTTWRPGEGTDTRLNCSCVFSKLSQTC